MKIFTGEELKNPYPLFPRDHYESNTDGGRAMQIDEGRHEMWEKCKLSILNQCVEVDFSLLPNWMASKVPEGDVDGETMLHLKDIPEIVSQFIQGQIKKQEKMPASEFIKLPIEERRKLLAQAANDPEIIKYYQDAWADKCAWEDKGMME